MTGRRHKVLIAEDDSGIRFLLEKILQREGFESETVMDGAAAIARIDSTAYDAIVLDVMMPGISGIEVIHHMRERNAEQLRRCVIVLTAASNRALQGIDEGEVFRVIRKPFEIVDLVGALRECVER